MSPPEVVLYNPRAVFFTMPLALVALGSTLRKAGVGVTMVDGRLDPDAAGTVSRAAVTSRVVGVSVLTGAPIHDAVAVSRAAKAAAPDCTVVWGGWHPSLFATDCLAEPSVDVVVVGQGEETLGEVVSRLACGTPIEGCPGTLVRRGDATVAGPSRPLRDLDALAPHDYSLLPVRRYFALKGKRQLDYVSSQGCRFRCAFCADPAVYGRAWTGLSPERVAEETARLVDEYDVDELAFQDETFFTSSARVTSLCERWLAQGVRVAWTATMRADQACRLTDDVLDTAVRAGLRRVMVGVESGSQATLDDLKKDMRLEQVERTAERLAARGLGAIFNFIVGFPDEPSSSIDDTLALARRLQRMSPQFETPVFYYRPYPGNPIADRAARGGYRFPSGLTEWADFDYVGGRGPWVSERLWRRVEAFKFYSKHASRPGAWRWPLRAAARWRCDREYYRWPVEKYVLERLRPPQPVS
jgi:radical SAM superfamily enzyme YgiQ (UPF0313 family)